MQLGAELAPVNSDSSSVATPAHIAAGQGRATVIAVLGGFGVPLDVQDRTRYGIPPAHWAAASGHIAVLEELQRFGALRARNRFANPVMHTAIMFGQLATIEFLAKLGHPVDGVNDWGLTYTGQAVLSHPTSLDTFNALVGLGALVCLTEFDDGLQLARLIAVIGDSKTLDKADTDSVLDWLQDMAKSGNLSAQGILARLAHCRAPIGWSVAQYSS